MTQFLGRLQYYFSAFINVFTSVGNSLGSYPILVFMISLSVVIFVVRLVKYYS